MVSGRVRTGLCILVAVIWSGSIVLSWLRPEDYKPDPAVNAVFSTVIGAVVVLGGKEKEKPKTPPKRSVRP